MWDCEDLDTISRTMAHHPFKSYREKVRRWLLFTRTPAQLRGPHVLSKLIRPAWDACDELEPEDVATAGGVNMILDTLAEAFQGEYDVGGSHTAYVSQAEEALVKSEEQEEDIDAETALAALEQESDNDLEETDVQEILLAYKESRQLRWEQRVNCDQEYRVCNDDVSCQPNVDCEWGVERLQCYLRRTSPPFSPHCLAAQAMESSVLALRTRCRTAIRAVRVRERRRSIASGASGTHGLHAA